MKLKTLPLMILLLALLTQISYAQMPTESQGWQSSDFGIESEQFYPGTLVLELIETAEAEIDAAVREAYAEGYKAAMLQYAPDAAAYKIEVEILRKEIEAERRKGRLFWPAVGISAGVSFSAGFLLFSFIGR